MLKKAWNAIWPYLKPFKKEVYFLLIISFVSAAISAAVPLIYGWLLDQTISGQSLKVLGLGLAVWFIISQLNNWLSRLINRHADILSIYSSRKLLLEYAHHFLSLPFSYLKEQKIGKKISSVDRASGFLERAISSVIFDFLPDALTIVLILFVLLKIHWLLSLVLFSVLVIYIVITLQKSKAILMIHKKIHRAYEATYGDYYEYLSNYETVKAFAGEEAVVGNINNKIGHIINRARQYWAIWSTLSAWQSFIFGTGFTILFGLSILMLRNNQLTAGNLVSFIGYIYFIFGVMSQLADKFTTLNRAIAEINQTKKLFNVETESELRGGNLIEIDGVIGGVVFNKVGFQYPGKDQPAVLKNVSFNVKPGEVIALVGESGAGKSTLIDLISGYYLPTSGDILIDKYNTKNINSQDLRRHVSLVPQEVSLFHESISFNISYGRESVKQSEIEMVAKAANAHDFIMKFPKGYRSKVGERGVKLSVGQKQRVAIARALLRYPEIIILDEATSSLDSITEREVQEALNRLIKGRTTFIIAHRLSTIVHADRIFVLDKGEIVESGKHEELLKKENGVYRKLYEAQKF